MFTRQCKIGMMVALLIGAAPSIDAKGWQKSDVAIAALGAGIAMGGMVYVTQSPPSPAAIIAVSLLTSVAIGYLGYRQTPGYVKDNAYKHYLECKERYEEALAVYSTMRKLTKNPTEELITELIKPSEDLDSFGRQLGASQARRIRQNVALYREYASGVEDLDEAFIKKLLAFAHQLEDMQTALGKLIILRNVKNTLAELTHTYADVFQVAAFKKDLTDSPLTDIEVQALSGDAAYPYLAVDSLFKKLHGILFQASKDIILIKKKNEDFSLTQFQKVLEKKARVYEVAVKEKQADVAQIQAIFLSTYKGRVREDAHAKKVEEDSDLERRVAEARMQTEMLNAEAEMRKAEAERQKAEAAREREQTRRAETLIDSVDTLADIFDVNGNRTQRHRVRVRTNV